jgi:hypothetical protein
MYARLRTYACMRPETSLSNHGLRMRTPCAFECAGSYVRRLSRADLPPCRLLVRASSDYTRGVELMPFAVGQILDVGVVLLSAMASGVAEYLTNDGSQEGGEGAASHDTARTAVASALLLTTVTTTIAGIVTLIVGES